MIRTTLQQISPFARGLRPQLLVLVGLALVAGLAEAGALMLTVRVVLLVTRDEVDSADIEVLGAAFSSNTSLVVAAALAVVATILHFAIARRSAALSAGVMYETRRVILNTYFDATWPTQAAEREGSMQEASTTLASRLAAVVQSVSMGATQLAVLLTFGILAVIVDPLATVVVVVTGVLLQLALRPMAHRTRRRSEHFVETNSRFAEDVSKLTSNAMELRSFGVSAEAERALDGQAAEARGWHASSRAAALQGSTLFKDAALLLLIAAAAVAAAALGGSDRSFDGVGVVLTLVIRSIASAQQINSANQLLSEHSPAARAVETLLARLRAGSEADGHIDCSAIDVVEFDDVSFEYVPGEPALRSIDLRIERGDAIGVVGASGGGKSTLVQVLLRLRTPTSGRIVVNGTDAAELTARSLAAAIGFVPQEPTLLEATIADNVSFYRDIDRATVVNAARRANILDVVEALPDGFDTVLGPRGAGMSGGQKQRLAIARALAGEPSLLVLDEPSSALDAHSEAALAATLSDLKGEMTLLVVAHRPATLGACDRFLLMRRGEVSETATLAEALTGAELGSGGLD